MFHGYTTDRQPQASMLMCSAVLDALDSCSSDEVICDYEGSSDVAVFKSSNFQFRR